MKKKKVPKKYIIIFSIILTIISIIALDTVQALWLDNEPIITLRKEYHKGNKYTTKYGFLTYTRIYCDNSRETGYWFANELKSYRLLGCEGDTVEDLIKQELASGQYDFIVNVLKASAPTIEKMYDEGKFTEEEAKLSALALEELTGCNMQKEFKQDWQTADEFYKLWKKSKCPNKIKS